MSTPRRLAAVPARGLALVVFCTALGYGAFAAAQSSSAVALGRAEFDAGLTAWRQGQAAVALARFERAYALLPQPLVLLNLAGAQAATDRLLASAESYRRFLRQADAGPAAAYRAAAQRALEAVVQRTPRVQLTLHGLQPDDRVMLDGEPLVRAALAADLPVDPGTHTLVIERGPSQTVLAQRSFALVAGGHSELVLALPAPLARPAARGRVAASRVTIVRKPAEHVANASLFASPWFWVATASVLAVGAAAGVYLVVAPGARMGGNVPPGTLVVP